VQQGRARAGGLLLGLLRHGGADDDRWVCLFFTILCTLDSRVPRAID
jgi:hypothetical protein